MSEKHKLLTDDTGKEIVSALNLNNQVLTALLQSDGEYDDDWKKINANIVNGLGKILYPVLSKFSITANADSTSVLNGYTLPLRVIDHDVDLKKTPTGEVVSPHTATIEFCNTFYNSRLFSHGEKPYAITTDTTFKSYKNYYLPVAGEYEFFINRTSNAGNYLAENTYYELIDGAYVLTADECFKANKDYYVQKYELASVTTDNTIPPDVYYEKNERQLVLYGTNCWRDSLLRMWLNSDKPAGQWWKPNSIFSIKPPEADKVCGFLYGLPEEFKNCLVETEQVSTLPTVKRYENENYYLVCDDEGENEVGKRQSYTKTRDKVFIASLSQMYVSDNTEMGQPYTFYKKYSDNEYPTNKNDSNRIKTQIKSNASTYYTRTLDAATTSCIYLISADGSTGYYLTNINNYRCVPCFVLGNPDNI